MPFLQFNELKNLNEEVIHAEVSALKTQLFVLRLKKTTRQFFDPSLFKDYKRRIAQLLTLKMQKGYSRIF